MTSSIQILSVWRLENWCLDMTDRPIRLLVLDCDTEEMILREDITKMCGALVLS